MQVVIVGGGVFGGCAAYELAKAGVAVTVVERDPIGAHASGKNPGNLNPILAAPPALMPFAMESFRLHEQLLEELSALGCTDYDVEPVRRVLVCFDEQDRQELLPIEKLFNGQKGFSTGWLDADAVHQKDSRLSRSIIGGLFIEGNRSLDARAFNQAIMEGAIKQGARLLAGSVKGVDPRPGGGYKVHTGNEDLECDALVLATGPWVADTKAWLGIDLPVRPVKGEMLRMRLAGPNITHDFTRGLISLYRRGDGEVWVGVTREDCGFDEQPSERGRHELLEGAARILPAIREAELLEHLASLRPMAPGGVPIIGQAPGLDKVFIANGGGIKGILTCAGVAHAIKDLVLTGSTGLSVSSFAI